MLSVSLTTEAHRTMNTLLDALTSTMHRMHWYEFAGVAVIGVVALCSFGIVAVEIGGAVRRFIRRKVHAPRNPA
jgi:hypothetical protein